MVQTWGSLKQKQHYQCGQYKMQTENLYIFFFVWYMITCHLTTNRASRNHFFAIIFHDYLHYCGILLATSLIIFLKHNFKPSYSLLALCISWLVWRLYRIYQLNMSPLNIKRAVFEKQLTALHVMCLFCLKKKVWTETETVPLIWYIFNI